MSPARFGLRELGGMLVVAGIAGLVLVGLVMCGGCGRTALGHSYETLGIGHMAHNETVKVVRAQLQESLGATCGDVVDTVERLECGQGVGVEFREREAGINASAETVDILSFAVLTWARRVAAKEADEDAPPLSVCEALSRLTASIDAWATVADASLPIDPWVCPEYDPNAETEVTP